MVVLIFCTEVNLVEEGHPRCMSNDIRTNWEPAVPCSKGSSIRRRSNSEMWWTGNRVCNSRWIEGTERAKKEVLFLTEPVNRLIVLAYTFGSVTRELNTISHTKYACQLTASICCSFANFLATSSSASILQIELDPLDSACVAVLF